MFHLLGGGQESKQGFVGHVIGGMGAITSAMAEAVAHAEWSSRRRAPCRRCACAADGADGVVLADGSEIEARIVVSNADPRRTFLGLVPPGSLDPEFAASVRAIKMDGPCGKLNLVLSEEPRLTGADQSADALQRAQFTLVPWLDGAQRCYERARHGEIDARLWIDCLALR